MSENKPSVCGKNVKLWPYGECNLAPGHEGHCDRRVTRPVR